MNHLVGLVLWPVARPLARWAQSSQRGACRNAMVASTALTDRRRERDEVEEFLAAFGSRRPRRIGAAPFSPPASRLG
jgi:hypothetical protein